MIPSMCFTLFCFVCFVLMVHGKTDTRVVVVVPTTREWTQGVSTSRCVCTDSLIDSYTSIHTEKKLSKLFHFVHKYRVVARHHREYILYTKRNNHV